MSIKNEKLFEELVAGDLVRVKMPVIDEELDKIEPSRRVFTYLVVKKEDGFIYGYRVSVKRNPELNNYQVYGIDKAIFGNPKNSWINLKNIEQIPADNLIEKMFHLNLKDLSMIEKRLQIQVARGKAKFTFGIPFQICAGDVIQYANPSKALYYVINVDENTLICYPVSLQFIKHWRKIKVNSQTYYIDFFCQFRINNINNAKVVNILNSHEIDIINKKKMDYIKQSKKHM